LLEITVSRALQLRCDTIVPEIALAQCLSMLHGDYLRTATLKQLGQL
jgi:hypothetical protein